MKVLHISDIYNANGNGVAVALTNYIKYEKKYAEIGLYNLNSIIDCECDNIFNKKEYESIDLLPNGFDKPDLVVFNEVYKKTFLKLYRYCLKNKIPYIIIPHGCLVTTAQKKKKLKKIIGNIVFFNRFIKKANAIQFLNKEEKEQTKFKYKNYIISGNGVDNFVKENNYKKDIKKLVYIGRYAIYAKGLDILVELCKDNYKWFIDNKVIVELYGRNSGNDLEVLEELINKNEISDILQIKGSVYGSDKEKVLKDSYAFIQTSRHEGQPMGIMEAMAFGLPCIVTEGTNFSEFINIYKCGIGTSFDKKMVFNSIKTICNSDDIRNEYSNNAIIYSKKFFSCDEIAKDAIEKYKNLIERK